MECSYWLRDILVVECFEGDPGSGVLLLVEGHQCYFWLRDIL